MISRRLVVAAGCLESMLLKRHNRKLLDFKVWFLANEIKVHLTQQERR